MVFWSCGGDDDPPLPPTNEAPTIPSLNEPINDLGSVNDPENPISCINENVEFRWNASTDPNTGDVISYILEVSKTSSFTTLIPTEPVSTTSTTIALDKGVSFYWRVKAKDNQNATSDYSTVYKFYTEGDAIVNRLPDSPVIDAPALDETVLTNTTTLKWTAIDDDPDDTLTYDVFFATDEDVVKEALKEYYKKIEDNPDFDTDDRIGKDQSENTLIYNSLEVTTNYYWIVVVKDGKGGQTIGQVWNFNTNTD